MTKLQIITLVVVITMLLLITTTICNYKQQKIATLTQCPTIKKPYYKISTPNADHHIVLLGDSRIKDWGEPLLGLNTTVINLAVAASTTYQIRCRLESIISLKPDLVILQAGVNDLVAASLLSDDLRVKAETESFLNLKRITAKLTASKIKILLLTIVPPLSPNLLRQLIWGSDIEKSATLLNQRILTETMTNVTIYNMKNIFYDFKTSAWKKGYARDALHWNDDAYQLLTERIREVLVNNPDLLR